MNRLLYGLLFLLILTACVPEKPVEEEEHKPLFYPPAPSDPRFVFELSLQSPADIYVETGEDRLKKLATGQVVSDKNVFTKPYDVAARYGRIYISDTLAGVVHVFDVPRRKYFTFGVRFEGELGKPTGLDVDHEGRVYVADRGRKLVVVYDALGLFQRLIGDKAGLKRPTDVAASPDGKRIYISDNAGLDGPEHRVMIFNNEGEKLGEFGGLGTEEGKFNIPASLTVGKDGRVYVLDAGNFRVQCFDADGQFLFSWGAVGNRSGQLARARGINTDDLGNIYVSDAQFGNIQLFNAEGQLLMDMGNYGEENRPGNFIMLAGVATDETGRVYAVDQIFRRISVFRKIGKLQDDSVKQSQ